MLVLCADNAAEFLAAVDAFAQEIQRGCVDVVRDTCFDGAEHARAVGQFQDHSGSNGLRASIKARPVKRTGTGAEGSFGTDKPYAAAVEGGQKPHEIRARNRKFLRWEQNGEVRFARVVQHPGTRGKPFMGPAAIKAEGVLYARTELLTARAIAHFQGRQ